jgi:hypothetical protein
LGEPHGGDAEPDRSFREYNVDVTLHRSPVQ